MKHQDTDWEDILDIFTQHIPDKGLTRNSPTLTVRHVPGGPAADARSSHARGAGLIPRQGAQIPHALWPKHQNKNKNKNKKIQQMQYCNKFNKDLKKKPST